MTYPILKAVTNTTNVKTIANNYALVVEIQSLLQLGKFYKGSINGFWDIDTEAAFETFKVAAFLEHPDLLGKTTAEALLEIAGQGKHPTPKDSFYPTRTEQQIRLPGNRLVSVSERIPGCNNFTWGEATKIGTRVPADSNVVTKIIQLAQYLDRIKAYFNGRAIRINSWYRPPHINRAVGGVSNSTHLLGSAVDFTVAEIAPLEVYRQLDSWHGRIGGLGRSTSFTHLDLRGYPARWRYGA